MEIAYLFKGEEYEHEEEIRLILLPLGLEEKIKIDETFEIPKVYIETCEILSSVSEITIGPKVAKAEELATTFYHNYKKEFPEKEKLKITISKLPYK